MQLGWTAARDLEIHCFYLAAAFLPGCDLYVRLQIRKWCLLTTKSRAHPETNVAVNQNSTKSPPKKRTSKKKIRQEWGIIIAKPGHYTPSPLHLLWLLIWLILKNSNSCPNAFSFACSSASLFLAVQPCQPILFARNFLMSFPLSLLRLQRLVFDSISIFRIWWMNPIARSAVLLCGLYHSRFVITPPACMIRDLLDCVRMDVVFEI